MSAKSAKYFTAIFKGALPKNWKASDLTHAGCKCVGIAGGNAHAERWRLHDALVAIARETSATSATDAADKFQKIARDALAASK